MDTHINLNGFTTAASMSVVREEVCGVTEVM
jgi:hypothetical protein